MATRATTQFDHDQGSARGGAWALRLYAEAPRARKCPAAKSRQRVRDGELAVSAPKAAPIQHLGLRLIDIVAPLGLSLFLTAGFAAELRLHTGSTLASPTSITVCGGVFLWTLALISCAMSRR